MNTISSQLECISDLCKHFDLYIYTYIYIKKQHNTGPSVKITACYSFLGFSFISTMNVTLGIPAEFEIFLGSSFN